MSHPHPSTHHQHYHACHDPNCHHNPAPVPPPRRCHAHCSTSSPAPPPPTTHAPQTAESAFISFIAQLTSAAATTSNSREHGQTQPHDGERRVAGVSVSTIRNTAICAICSVACYRMFMCCCWPVHKCATILSLFDTCIVAVFAYNVFKHVMAGQRDVIILGALFFCVAFLVCQVLGTVFVILAPKRKLAHYCWPRMVLIAGLLICGLLAVFVLILYFSGNQKAMSGAFISTYEFFFDDNLTESEKTDVRKEMGYYVVALMVLSVVFVFYTLFELLLLRKMHNELKSYFSPVATSEPSAPPAFNPEFGAGKA